MAVAVIYDELGDDFLETLSFEELLEVYSWSPKNSAPELDALNKLMSLATTFEDWVTLLMCASEGDELVNLALKKLIDLASNLDELLIVYYLIDPGNELELLVFKKIRKYILSAKDESS